MLRRKQGKIARSLTLVLTIATCTGNKTKRKKWDCIKQRFCITNEKLIKMTQWIRKLLTKPVNYKIFSFKVYGEFIQLKSRKVAQFKS